MTHFSFETGTESMDAHTRQFEKHEPTDRGQLVSCTNDLYQAKMCSLA
jgi:hypothetical protein